MEEKLHIIWEPYGHYLKSRVAEFMHKFGAEDIWDLRKKSQEDIEHFWREVEKFLGIKWRKKYTKVLDVSQGIEWAKWFVDGKINLSENCLKYDRNFLAVIWENEEGKVRRLTFGELSDLVSKIGSALKKLGVKKGDRVGLFMPMTPEALASFLAIAHIGAIVVPMFSGYGPDAVRIRLQDAEAKLLITADGTKRRGKFINMKEVADESVKDVQSCEKVLVFRYTDEKIPRTQKDVFASDVISSDGYAEPEEVDSEHPFMIIYTSGTTGKPKGAVHVHGGFLVKIAEEGAFQMDLKPGDIMFWITDIGWIMGPWEFVASLANGAAVFLYDGAPDYPYPSRVFEMIEKHKITSLGLSPTFVRSLMKFKDEEVLKHNISSLKYIGSTGEPMNYAPYMWVFEKVGKGKIPIINLSGGTEVAACFLSPHPIDKIKPMSLVGPALGMDIDIFGSDGKPVKRGEVGELVCKKPWPGMTRGLWRDPQRYKEAYWSTFEGVWYHGDFASQDEDGFWFLHGRSDDTLKVAGKRVGPAEIETAVIESGKVVECAAIGVPDEVKGEVPVVFAVLKPGVEPSEKVKEEIKNIVAQKLGKAIAPKDVKFVSALPKTRNAKIMRRLIRAKYLGKPLGDISSLENPSALDEIEKAM
ncbi:Acetyl-coenzyme A synthetase [bacterium HR19]|nr:Acetyl-coenzyme A synthetase [bacterium HR19]